MRAYLGLAVMISIGVALPAWAQESSNASGPAPNGEDRVLGGHRFMVSDFVPAPFITTDFTILTGLGLGSANVAGAANQLGALSEGVRLQVAPIDWLSLRAGATGIVLSGVNQDAALNYGAAVGYGLLGGASAGWRFDRLRVAGSIDIEQDQSYNFNILSAIQQSVAAGAVNASTLLVNTSVLTITAGGQAAYGFSPAAGAFGAVQLASVSYSGSASQSDVTMAAGGGLSIDLGPVIRFPVGFLAAYNLLLDFPSSGASSATSHQISGGVYYTGSSHLQLGVEGRATLETDLTIFEGVFCMRYFW